MRTGELNSLNGGLFIVLITMIVLSWQVTVIALVLLAAYLLLAKWVGRKLQLTTGRGCSSMPR